MPLRMKATSYDDAVVRAQKRAARRSKHRSRTTRPESLTPPRNPPKEPYFGEGPDDELFHADDDGGLDRPELPPAHAHKRTRTDDEFLEALADAEAADQGIGAFEDDFYARQVPAYATRYSSAAGAAAGIAPAGPASYLQQMDEDEYAEYVRAGMWRRRNREEVERLERLEKERRAKEERDRREREKAEREERERIRRLEERKKRKSKEEEIEARKRYDEGWSKLQQAAQAAAATPAASASTPASPAAPPAPTGLEATVGRDSPPDGSADDTPADKTVDKDQTPSASTAFPLRFSDFPWPLYPPMAFPPLSWPSTTDITSESVSTFLLPDSLPSEKHKTTLRQAVLAYHPDRFERYVLRVPEDREDVRERLRDLGLRVSQVLNDLAKRGG